MTINKAQGQTFERVGIYLPQPVFSHGQLYVAFSRARAMSDVYINIENTEQQGKRGNRFITNNVQRSFDMIHDINLQIHLTSPKKQQQNM